MKFQPTKEFYLQNRGKVVSVRHTRAATVSFTTTNTRSGSWERGFKFHTSEWAVLERKKYLSKHYRRLEFSMDHGKTWHPTIFLAKKSKGKLKLSTGTHKEFAFDSIQKINRDYDPDYKWRA